VPGAERPASALTGRITAGPHELLRQETLRPQLDFEIAHLLPGYLNLERVLLVEYRRMGLLSAPEVRAVATALDEVTPAVLDNYAEAAMSDLAFAVERYVSDRIGTVPAAWHVDRSRNDLQATAQSLYGRDRILELAGSLGELAAAALDVAAGHADEPMPGYTHLQAAQVISPGFYLTALAEQVVHTLERLQQVYRTANASALGAGAMAGQELGWDRARMARLLGCDGVRVHALRAVAGRDWPLEVSAELSLLGVVLSRFVTDVMSWGSGAYGFIDLPDEWSGISSAMPQKKNFPVLERLRGRLAHLSAGHIDVLLGQRNTSYANSVEVSKEAGSPMPAIFAAASSSLRLGTAVLRNLRFRTDRMRAACEAEFLGGFSLANQLTLTHGVPWRTAQVIAGQYVVAAARSGRPPGDVDAALLEKLAAQHGHPVSGTQAVLTAAFDVDRDLHGRRSAGATSPDMVRTMVADTRATLAAGSGHWRACRDRITDGARELAGELTS
jgi:argininosuccinate lyase